MRLERFSKPHWVRFRYGLAAVIVLIVTSMNLWLQMVARVQGNDQCRWIDRPPASLLVADVVGDGVSDRAGLRNGDIILAIDGLQFRAAPDGMKNTISLFAQTIINKDAGGRARYLVERDGKQFEIELLILKSINLQYIASFMYGVGFLLVGLIVVLVKPLGALQRAFGKYGILTMLFFGLVTLTLDAKADPFWMRIILGSAFIVATVAAMPHFVRFFLLFPVHRSFYDRRWFTILLYVVSTIIGLFFYAAQPLPVLREYTGLVANLRYLFPIAGLGLFMHSYYRRVARGRRRELRPIVVGSAIAILTFSYTLYIPPFAAFINPTLALPAMVIVIVPVLFGYAIFRYGLMDVDLLVQRTLTYGIVTAAMAGIYLAVVYGIGSVLTSVFGAGDDRVMHIAALVLIAVAFEPIKSRLQQNLDRLFYRERYDYQQALRELSEELPQLLDLRQILDALVQRISSTMHIDRMAVVICDDREGCLSVGKNVDQTDCTFSDADGGLQALLRTMRKPLDFHLLTEGVEHHDLAEADVQKLHRAGVVLTVPMLMKERLVGFINVGPKMSGRGYGQEDVNLLATVAAQAAIAIENARLHRSELEKERIREELSLAREIQKGLLPKGNPTFAGLDLAGVSIPATSVGGDYYDFISASPGRMLVVVADVSGKGMSAALYMSKIQGMVQLAAHMYESPKEMLVHINRRIFEGMDRRSFITMVLAQFDLTTNEVRICRAGHTKAIVSDGETLRFLEGSGIALGLERGPIFEEQIQEVRLPLREDGLYVLYTDGISEAMNETQDQYGEERLMALLQRSSQRPAMEIEQALLDDVAAFRAGVEQYDDVTLAVVKRL